MKLDLSEILAHVGMRCTYTVEEPPIVDEYLECSAPIQGRIVFANTGSVLLIDGSVETRVTLSCSRCLVYYEESIQAQVEEQFPLETRSAGPRSRQTRIVVEEDENPDAGRLFDGPLLDLTEMLRQNISINLPTRPLHDESCQGLCPTCGKDLNEGSCGCVAEGGNYALRPLAVLLEEQNTRE